jgi:prepilin-type N-terminal cleavage/methylation domain-containing protein
MTLKRHRGFSLLELLSTIAIGLTMASVTFISLMPLFNKNHVDQAYDLTLSTLRSYRNLAITQSDRYVITFPTNQSMLVQRWGYVPPPGVSPAPVTVATYNLPQDIQFNVQAGFPNPGPDSFGSGTTAVAFQTSSGVADTCAVVAGGSPCMVFYPDGSAQDDSGNFEFGVIYLTPPAGNIYSSRAIDVWGTTGRLRGWRLYNQSGNTWVQQ